MTLHLYEDDDPSNANKVGREYRFKMCKVAVLFWLPADCIGSAFNMKGAMQCPNCRNVEKGQWLFANGSPRAFPEFVMEDLIPEEDLYALTYPEMVKALSLVSFRVLLSRTTPLVREIL